MTLFDYLVLFILITSIIISTMRGLLKEILSLIGWISAFFVANAYCEKLAALLPFEEYTFRLITAFVALFIGTLILMGLLSKAIDSILTASGLKLMDRGLGSLFGLARGIVIVLACMVVGGMTHLPHQPFWKHSLFRPTIETAALSLKPYLPNSVARHMHF